MTLKPLTGRKVFLITALAFGVVIAVNVTLAVQAVRTFPGLEVDNSYIASQNFDAKRAAQEQLGWVLNSRYDAGRLTLQVRDEAGNLVAPRDLTVLIGRTTVAQDDMRPALERNLGTYSADIDLARGKWMMVVEATSDNGTAFRQRLVLQVKG